MKNLKALFALAISFFLSSQSQAGIVYGSRWVHPETNQEVVLLGDRHNTHEQFGDQDHLQAQELIKNLELAHSHKGVLILREDNGVRSGDKSFFDEINTYLTSLDREIFPGLRSINIDHRDAEDAFTMRQFFQESLYCKNDIIEPELIPFDTILIQVERLIDGCKDFMSDTIRRVNLCIQKTPNIIAKSIFTQTLETLIKNQSFCEQGIEFIKTTHGDLQNPGKFHAFFEHIEKFFTFFISDRHFQLYYQAIIVETEALLRITQYSKNFDAIVVIAGNYHLANLEKWLFQLGYERKNTTNPMRMRNNTAEKLLQDEYLAERKRLTLTSADSSYFFDTSNEKLDYFSIELDSVIKQRRSPFSLLARRLAINSFLKDNLELSPLVPIETFSWINNKDTEIIEGIPTPAKRKAQQIDDPEEKQEASHFVPKRKQPARKCNQITKYQK